MKSLLSLNQRKLRTWNLTKIAEVDSSINFSFFFWQQYYSSVVQTWLIRHRPRITWKRVVCVCVVFFFCTPLLPEENWWPLVCCALVILGVHSLRNTVVIKTLFVLACNQFTHSTWIKTWLAKVTERNFLLSCCND